MIEMNNSSGTFNGVFYDFTGYYATLNFNGDVIKVIRISDGKDFTNEFKEKYSKK